MMLSNNFIKNEFRSKQKEILCLIFIIIIACIVYYYNTKDLVLKIAYQGWGPQDYVNHKLYPENFKKDWPNGILAYDNSLMMRIYYYLAKYFNISPTTTMYPFMFIQIFIFLISVFFLSQTLFKNEMISLLCVFISICSYTAGLDLSRFSFGFNTYLKYPLYYGYANAFRIFALMFFLKDKFILCFIFLTISMLTHFTMGLFMAIFIVSYILYNKKLIKNKNFLLGLFIFNIIVLLWIFPYFTKMNNQIPKTQWILLTKIFSFHWYPSTLKMFTYTAHREFFPIILIIYFFSMSLLLNYNLNNTKIIKIIIGTIICIILTFLGLFFSEIYPIPFFIKISFQRCTGIITFIGNLFIVYFLYKKIKSGNLFIIAVSIYIYLTFIFSEPGIAVLPFILLILHETKNDFDNKLYKIIYILNILFILIIIFSTVIYPLWYPLKFFNPFKNFDFLLKGGAFKFSFFNIVYISAFAVILAFIIKIFKNYNTTKLHFIGITFIGILSILILQKIQYDQYLRWHNRYFNIAKYYLDVQLWAKHNTYSDSLFMPDPSHFYGWRDFSIRSSFGNLREWGYTSICYTSNYNIYLQGIKRIKEFGINVRTINKKDLNKLKSEIYGQKLAKDIRKIFYNMSSKQLKNIARKYNIDYIIMNKNYHKKKFKHFLLKVYENKYFIVYKTN